MSPFKREFEYFLLLCQTLNISDAAEQAGIQQAGLSKSLKVMESFFEKPLFYRTNRGLKMTPLGEILRENISKTMSIWEESFEKDLGQLSEVVGRYTNPTIGVTLVSKFFPYICEAYQGLKLDLELKKSSETTKDIIERNIDFGIVANPAQHPDLVIVPVASEFIACWSKTKTPKMKVLYYNPEMINIVHTLKKYKGYKKVPVTDYEVIASLVENSDGVSILPSPVAERFSGLVQVGKKITSVTVCLIYRHDILKTKAFLEISRVIKEVIYQP